MFQRATSKVLQWLENGKTLGLVNINDKHDFKIKTERPMERNKGALILSISRVNYALLDQFIMNCLNDYYKKINETKKEEERMQRVNEYNTLYQLWYQVSVAKQNNDINLNSYYDDIVYRLYLLGYHS